MPRIEKSIEVGVPIATAYGQWTQFEEFPKFMEGIDSVVQRDDQFLDWTASVAGQTRNWTAKIVDQTPNVRIAWKSVEGAQNAGAVLFTAVGPDQTRVDLTIDVEPEGPVESAGTALGFLDRRVEGDLERFKKFIEGRSSPAIGATRMSRCPARHDGWRASTSPFRPYRARRAPLLNSRSAPT
jgi:uncharacterized membrane protein